MLYLFLLLGRHSRRYSGVCSHSRLAETGWLLFWVVEVALPLGTLPLYSCCYRARGRRNKTLPSGFLFIGP